MAVNNEPLFQKENQVVGYVLSHEQFPVPKLLEYGRRAEQAGFDAIWGSDHFQPWQDNEGHAGFAWVTLGALGQHVKRLTMGTGVTCPTYRYHPAVVAQAFATLSQLSEGRIFLGVGSGEALNETAATGDWGDYEERGGKLAEAVELIRELWKGEQVDHKGQYYTTNAKLYDVPPRPIPIYIAATGPKSMKLAGMHGDGLISDPDTVAKPELMQAFHEGARAAGKDPDSLPIIVELFMVVGDEAEAKKYAPIWQFLPDAWTKYVGNPDPVDIRKKATQNVPVEKVLKMWTVSPDPAKFVEKIQGLLDKGISHVYLHSPQPNQEEIIDWLGSKVLTQLKKSSASVGAAV